MTETSMRDEGDDDERRPSWLLDGMLELHFDEDRRPMVVVSAEAPFTSRDVVLGDDGPAPADTVELELRWAALAASTVLAIVAAGLSAAGVLDSSGSTAALAGTLLNGVVLLAGAYGTFSLYTDATYLSYNDRNWSPSPWPYLVPGGLVVAVYLFWRLGVTDPTSLPVPALVGLALVAAALSAVPTGPAYLYNRHRTIGLFTE